MSPLELHAGLSRKYLVGLVASSPSAKLQAGGWLSEVCHGAFDEFCFVLVDGGWNWPGPVDDIDVEQ